MLPGHPSGTEEGTASMRKGVAARGGSQKPWTWRALGRRRAGGHSPGERLEPSLEGLKEEGGLKKWPKQKRQMSPPKHIV